MKFVYFASILFYSRKSCQKDMPKKVKLTPLIPVNELKNKYKKETNPRVKERLLVPCNVNRYNYIVDLAL